MPPRTVSAPEIASPVPPPAPSPEFESHAHAFLLRLGRALHEQGTPSHRLEEAMQALCRRMGITAQFFSTPTMMFASIDRVKRDPAVHLLRVGNGGIDMGRLSDFDEVGTRVAHAELTPEEGLVQIEAIERSKPRYGPGLLTFCYAVNSAAAAVIFGGGVPEMITSWFIGLCTGLLALVSGREGQPWRAFDATAAYCAAFVATVAASFAGPVSIHVAVLAGIVALLPGYTLTIAIAELANRHLASGSARVASAAMSFVTLGFGVALGTRVAELLFGHAPTIEPTRLSVPLQFVAVALAAGTFSLIFRARLRDFPWVFVVSVLGFLGARFGAMVLGPELGAFIGSLTVAMSANVYARVLDRPAVVPLLPGMMLLVPGSIGFRSFSSLMANDVVSGVQTAFTMILVAVAIVAGLLIANDLLPARRAL